MDALKPFLAIPLSKVGIRILKVSQGWDYSEDERLIHPDLPRHYAVDIPGYWGMPIYAPADGLALASYHTHDIHDSSGRTIGYGLGLFVQIWHEPRVYSMYAHLSEVNKNIPYLPPVLDLDNGDWQPRAALHVPVGHFISNSRPVKRGTLLGKMGYSGLSLGFTETPSNPPTIDPEINKTWDPAGAHLHWEVYTRTPDGRNKDKRFDPFGIYGERAEYTKVFTKAHGLILADEHGSPQFAYYRRY